MRRAPLVIGATGAGLGLLLSFHTEPVHVDATGAGTSSAAASDATSVAGGTPTTTTPAGASRSATGQLVQYRYGDLELRVTEEGSRITAIEVISDAATDPRSAQINSQAIPILHQEAMGAQSSAIDGVSGATFTTEAYEEALQSALDRLQP